MRNLVEVLSSADVERFSEYGKTRMSKKKKKIIIIIIIGTGIFTKAPVLIEANLMDWWGEMLFFLPVRADKDI